MIKCWNNRFQDRLSHPTLRETHEAKFTSSQEFFRYGRGLTEVVRASSSALLEFQGSSVCPLPAMLFGSGVMRGNPRAESSRRRNCATVQLSAR